VGGTSRLRSDLDSSLFFPGLYSSQPTEHLFPEVEGSKVRFIYNNCQLTTGDGHGGIYEFEVFSAASGADLVARSFNYKVREDASGDRNGPLPINATVTFSADILNQGTSDGGPFTVRFYLSQDQDIDPSTDEELVLRTANGNDLPCCIRATGTGTSRFIACTVKVNRINLKQDLYHGQVWVGMVIDADDDVAESDETNNANQGISTDIQSVPLYDPILRRAFNYRDLRDSPGAVRRFASSSAAEDFLRLQSFEHPTFFPPNLYADSGWSKPLPSPAIRSWFNGQYMPAEAFRIQANVVRKGSKYVVRIQGGFNIINEILVPTFGEPSPVWAETHPTVVDGWLNYVRDYHIGLFGNRF
jgi:hypothetical protein